MPVHQGRAAEHLLAKVFVKPGDVMMNYHFTTTKAHVELAGGTVLELFGEEALNPKRQTVQGEHGPEPAQGSHQQVRRG